MIETGVVKKTGRGYVNPKSHQAVSIIKTVHGRHYYAEDWYADKANKLN